LPHFSHRPGAISKDRLGVKIYPGCTMVSSGKTGEVDSAKVRKLFLLTIIRGVF